MRPLAEQVILMTGATDGLGKAAALHLARAGATLLLHGRDEARGQQTLDEIREQTGNTRLQWYRADFSWLCCKKKADLLKSGETSKRGPSMTEQNPFKWRHFQADIHSPAF